jgi:hypothetical protein
VTGIDSLKQLADLYRLSKQEGSDVRFDTSGKGFLGRNTKIAQASQWLVAFTWGKESVPISPGTLDTWNKCQNVKRTHVSLAHLLPELAAKSKIWCMTGKSGALWTSKNCKQNANALFVFGDNDLQVGALGQACIRGQPNAVGVPTKKKPLRKGKDVFYTDAELERNKQIIDKAMDEIQFRGEDYEHIYFPKDGLGTGLAELPVRAPLTYQYLCNALLGRFGVRFS